MTVRLSGLPEHLHAVRDQALHRDAAAGAVERRVDADAVSQQVGVMRGGTVVGGTRTEDVTGEQLVAMVTGAVPSAG